MYNCNPFVAGDGALIQVASTSSTGQQGTILILDLN